MRKWTRRGLIGAGLLTGGVLAVGVAIRPGNRLNDLAPLVTEGDEQLVNVWIKLGPDNTATAIVPHCEMGQGAQTALAMIVCEELDMPWENMAVEEAPAHPEYANSIIPRYYLANDLNVPGIVEDTVNGAFLTIAKSLGFQTTGGSMSVRGTGFAGLAIAAAATRAILIEAASREWGVPEGEVTTKGGMVRHAASGSDALYADFAAAAAELTPPVKPKLKKRSEYTVIGQSKPRFDIPSKVDGTAKFAIDVELPGMKYAAIAEPPVFSSTVAAFDADAALQMPGVREVLDLGTFVAVIADKYWQARKGLEALDIEFTKTDFDDWTQESIFERHLAAIADAEGNGDIEMDDNAGDARAAFDSAAAKVEAEYRVPFLAHTTMEPMTAAGWKRDGKYEIWAGMQNPLGSREAIAELLEIDGDDITMHNMMLGGAFGRRARPDFTNQIAQIVSKVDYPVKMIWSREDDVRHDHYRPAAVSLFKAGINAEGRPTSWTNHYVEKHDPAEASQIPYAIENREIGWAASETHVPFGAWRSVDHSQHGFFIESFIDELAHAAGQDPYLYRRSLLSNSPRHVDVLDRAAGLSGWDEKTEGRGKGIAIVESFGTIVAEVAEVELTEAGLKVVKVTCVADPGVVVNPDGFIAQMESGIIYGLTAALFGEITIEGGAVTQGNFYDYDAIRMHTAPTIVTELIESAAPAGGAGEPSTPPIAAAVTNAIFALTGQRIRELPVKKTPDLTVWT